MLTRAQLLAALHMSDRQLIRHLSAGLPYVPTGARGKVFDLEAVTAWLVANAACPSEKTQKAAGTSISASAASAFTAACRRAQVRATPSASKPS